MGVAGASKPDQKVGPRWTNPPPQSWFILTPWINPPPWLNLNLIKHPSYQPTILTSINVFPSSEDDFNGIEPITGNIKLDEYGDRVNSFLFWHLDHTGQWEVCLVCTGQITRVTWSSYLVNLWLAFCWNDQISLRYIWKEGLGNTSSFIWFLLNSFV